MSQNFPFLDVWQFVEYTSVFRFCFSCLYVCSIFLERLSLINVGSCKFAVLILFFLPPSNHMAWWRRNYDAITSNCVLITSFSRHVLAGLLLIIVYVVSFRVIIYIEKKEEDWKTFTVTWLQHQQEFFYWQIIGFLVISVCVS